MRALLFDVFGTCVDWRTSIMRERERFGLPPELADAWRDEYQPQLETVRSGKRPWVNLDVLHRIGLDNVLRRRGLTLAERDRAELVTGWHRLDPWPDVVEGLTRLKETTSSRPAPTATSPSRSTSPSTRSCRGTRSWAPRSPAPTSRTRASTGRASTRWASSRTRSAWSPRTATTCRRRARRPDDGVRRALRRGPRPAVRADIVAYDFEELAAMKALAAGWLTFVVFFFADDSLLSKSNLDSAPIAAPAAGLAARRDPVVRVRRDRRRRPPRGDARRAVRHADPDLQHRRDRGDADQHRDARRRRADDRPGHDVRGDDDRAQRRDRALARRRRPQAPHAGLQPARRERVPERDHPAGHDRADPAERHRLDRRGDALHHAGDPVRRRDDRRCT